MSHSAAGCWIHFKSPPACDTAVNSALVGGEGDGMLFGTAPTYHVPSIGGGYIGAEVACVGARKPVTLNPRLEMRGTAEGTL